ncbi:MAG: sulfotransferase [Acidimicrobiales bacterium]
MERAALVVAAADAADTTTDEIERSLATVAEPFDLLLDSLEVDAALTADGRAFTHRWLTRIIAERARLEAAARHDPAIGAERIDAPVIVAGAPRTGTTFLHGLLAQHPELRAPEGWELLFPAPPPGAVVADDDPRIAAADEELTWPQRRSEGMMSIHRYAGRMHKECLSAMSFAFRSEEFISRYRVPRYVDWLQACDMTPAYDRHRLVLQSLQRHRPSRWVLKSPVHLNNLPTVLASYPDARVVITHREPTEVLGSVTSLVANLRRAFSDTVDETEIARYHLDLYGRSLDALVDADLPDAQVTHIDQRELIADPQGTLDGLCRRFDIAPVPVDARPPAEAGQHEYSLVGVDRAELDETFARYRERFLPDRSRRR